MFDPTQVTPEGSTAETVGAPRMPVWRMVGFKAPGVKGYAGSHTGGLGSDSFGGGWT